MMIREALRSVVAGMPISRRAWGNAGRTVRAERSDTGDGWDRPAPWTAVGPRDLDDADLRADDWFVVCAVH